MTIACVLHWYQSLLFLAPVAVTVAVIGVSEKLTQRREMREAAEERALQDSNLRPHPPEGCALSS
jgi:hypothetical protein